MIRCSALALVVLALSVCATASEGADERGLFAVKSVGTTSCQRYLDARKAGADEYVLYGGYLGGYMTAFNQLRPSTFDIMSWHNTDTLAGMMASYCRKHPQSNFAVSVAHLITVLMPRRLEADSPTLEIAHGGKTVAVYQESLRRIQVKLAVLGLYTGEPDGRYGPATRQALERFQAEQRLPRTGLPDQATLFRLSYKEGIAEGSE